MEKKDDNQKFTSLGELGEFGLIDHLVGQFPMKREENILGPGDDAAILKYDDTYQTVVSTDILMENVHFDLSYTPLKHLGYKSVIVNLSDIYAMNAEPTSVLVSIAMSNRFPLEAVEEIYKGIHLACEKYNVDVVGGDTTSSQTGLVINVTALGKAKPESTVRRDGANENDIIVVTGDLGGAYMGLQLLEREKEVFKVNPNMQPDLQGHEYVLERQLKPEARRDIIELLKKYEVVPTSMMDISDGLSSELIHIARKSDKGIQIYEDKLPISDGVLRLCDTFQLHPTTPVLNGGEDYELVFTISLDDFEKIKGDPNFSFVGHVTNNKNDYHLITKDEKIVPLEAQGWNALLNKDDSNNDDE